jgi:hypothetical protein
VEWQRLMGLDVSSGTQIYKGSRPHSRTIRFPRLRFVAVTTTHVIRSQD